MKRKLAWTFLLIFVFSLPEVQAQASLYSISGVVKTAGQETIPGAHVLLEAQEKRIGTQTNAQGEFIFSNIPAGTYILTASFVGYAAWQDTLQISAEDARIQVELHEITEELDAIIVAAKTENREIQEQPVRAAVVNTSTFFNQAVSLPELMNRTAGIRVRQTGGLGSATEVSINGYQGRSVRYFKNGIPLNYLQDGYSIASVPVNQLQRIEVYKGVLPVSLGADALGGAVNMVTKQHHSKHVDLSYETGSFNTHRASASGNVVGNNQNWFAGAEGFFNHSDNNYKANVTVIDPETRNPSPARLPLFHNAYTGHYAEAWAGLLNLPWADELRFSIASVYSSREEQHPALMTDSYGAAESRQSSIVPTLRYSNTFGETLHVDQFFAYNTLNTGRTDTLRGSYDWYGNFTPGNPQSRGESRQPSLSDVNFNTFTSRTYSNFRLASNQKIELNLVVTDVTRKGADPYGPRFEGTDIDILGVPASYQKIVGSAGWSADLFSERFTVSFMGKHYRYTSEGVDSWHTREISADETLSQTGHSSGVAGALKVQIEPGTFVRFSAEAANRLPEQNEIFGDGVWTVTNFDLDPEKSLNLNLGFRRDVFLKYGLETNLFYRKSEGMILLVPVRAPYAQYMNMENVRGMGMEADINVHLLSFLTANANATWQNLRLFDLPGATDSWKEDARLRNTPWFFYNAGLNANLSDLITTGDETRIYLNYSFVKEFYLETIPKRVEPGGFLGLAGSADVQSSLIIPDQHLLNAGLSYHPFGRSLSIGIDIKNILNHDLYDNYRIQKPGRSYHAKVNYYFNK